MSAVSTPDPAPDVAIVGAGPAGLMAAEVIAAAGRSVAVYEHTPTPARKLLLAGADKVSINTAAIHRPEFVQEAAEKFGAQCIVVAIDAKQVEPGRWEIFTHGGRKATGIDAVEWAKRMESYGAGEILLTSMDRDGTKSGFDLALTRKVADSLRIPVIASGGVGTLDHLVEGIREGHATAVLAASIFHFGTYTIGQAKAALAEAGIPVRPARGVEMAHG